MGLVCPKTETLAKPQRPEGLGVCPQVGADVPGSHCGMGWLSCCDCLLSRYSSFNSSLPQFQCYIVGGGRGCVIQLMRVASHQPRSAELMLHHLLNSCASFLVAHS